MILFPLVVTTEKWREYLTAKGRKEDKREGGRDRKTGKLLAYGPRVYMMESSILAQNERWRRVLSMQVGRDSPACWG